MRISARARLAVALALFALAPALLAQAAGYSGMPFIHTYLAKEYGGDPQVWTIVRDHRGLLYVGTSGDNIHQFDGAVWRTIPVASDVTRLLVVDDKGKIWAGGRAEFGYLEPDA